MFAFLFLAHIALSGDSVAVAPSHIDATRPLEQARFQCILGDKPSPYNSTTWTYRGHLLPCNQGDRKFACGDTLIISNVEGNDSGPYECHVNQSGSTLTAYGEITVPPALDNYKLEIVKQGPNLTVSLSCPVSSNSYPPPDVLWTVKGRFVSTEQILTVPSAVAATTYDCMAYNSYGVTNVKSFRMEEVPEFTPTGPNFPSEVVNSTMDFSSATGLVHTSFFLSRDIFSLIVLLVVALQLQ